MSDSSESDTSPRGSVAENPPIVWTNLSTCHLLDRVQSGDERALEEVLSRYLPRLRRWASGRLPRVARDIVDTDDLVQDSFIKVARAVGGIRERTPGTFPAYLRKTVLNRLRDEVRRATRRPGVAPLDGTELHPCPSPLEETIGHELADRYETAFRRLSDDDRAVLFLRVEMGMSFAEIAAALDKPSADAARMAVNRAGVRLAGEMCDARQA